MMGHHLLHSSAFYKRCFCSGNKNQIQVPVFVDARQKGLESCTNHPAAAVALHGIADFFACGNTDPQMLALVLANISDKHRSNLGFTFGINPLEVPVLVDCNDLITLSWFFRGSVILQIHFQLYLIHSRKSTNEQK